MKGRIVVKVGTNVLTRPNKRLDYNRIMDLVEQISTLHEEKYQVVFVSSGAAGAGREYFQFENEKDPIIRKQMLASIGQGRLFQVYADFFREHTVIPSLALISRKDFHSKTSFKNMKSTLEGLLQNNIVPIINENDVVSHRESTFGDNDQLAALTAAMLQADLLVILSDIPGFYTADPKKDKKAKLIPKVEKISQELISLCEDSLSDGGTGGMYSKVKAAELASSHGIATVVTSGKEENSLLKAVREGGIGTYFVAQRKKQLSVRGKWMVTGANLKGVITIDDGAQKAVQHKKKGQNHMEKDMKNSLLAVGVIDVEGEFKKKDVILIQNSNKIRIAVGMTNYSSKEIKEMIETKEKSKGKIVIHQNHLYTL